MIDLLKENFGIVQTLVAMILGAILQYMIGVKKGFRVFILIVIATVFTALLVWNLLLGLDGHSLFGFTFHISPDSPLLIVAVGSSALISMEFVAIIIQFLPSKIRHRFMESLDLKDVKNAK